MQIVFSWLLIFLTVAFAAGQGVSAQPVLTPGMTTVPPSIDYDSVVTRIDIPELLAVLPKPDAALAGETQFWADIWATDILFTREIWCLQFSFKSLRFIDVDIPNTEGDFDKKKVWYLVYYVENLGPAKFDENDLKEINSRLASAVLPGRERRLPVPNTALEDALPPEPLVIRQQLGFVTPLPGGNGPIRFVPQFVLATNRLVLGTRSFTNPETGAIEWESETTAVAYTDRVVPLALLKIMEREKMTTLETTVSIAQKDIAPGQGLWGVAMWTDVDPRMNEFSIFVDGLTNAYQWANEKTEGGNFVNAGKMGEGRIIKRRVLKLNWWRPGDANSLDESSVHFGSKDGKLPESIFDMTGRMSPEERREHNAAVESIAAQRSPDVQQALEDSGADPGWVSPAEKAVYHLMRQDWLLPTFGYEWVFL